MLPSGWFGFQWVKLSGAINNTVYCTPPLELRNLLKRVVEVNIDSIRQPRPRNPFAYLIEYGLVQLRKSVVHNKIYGNDWGLSAAAVIV